MTETARVMVMSMLDPAAKPIAVDVNAADGTPVDPTDPAWQLPTLDAGAEVLTVTRAELADMIATATTAALAAHAGQGDTTAVRTAAFNAISSAEGTV